MPEETGVTEVTPVIFRLWRGDVIALFPYDFELDPSLCGSYQHVGQHGSASVDAIVADSRPATLEERAPLFRELESHPYHYHLESIDERYNAAEARAARLKAARAYLQHR